ncbi:hypothetical protein ABS768_06960 [Flavobacterium sp. ST-75]|uniref:Chromate transporter n=1 Tax=Flavobacterium rhizophilum TaxID=3163296 RepID=A0ABW8YDE6_9FLAO
MKLSKYIQVAIGIIIGLVIASLGIFLYLKYVESTTGNNLNDTITAIKSQGVMGKVITIGAIPNLLIFFLLLRLKKDMMAWGIIIATAILTLITVFV